MLIKVTVLKVGFKWRAQSVRTHTDINSIGLCVYGRGICREERKRTSPPLILQQNFWYKRALSMQAASLVYKCWVGKMNCTIR